MSSVGPLVLDQVPERVWVAFQEGRAAIRESVGHPLLERWARARRLGAPTRGASVDDQLLRGEALRLRAEHAQMLQSIGSSALDEAAARVSERGFVLLLADPDGVVVRTEGGGAFRDEARRVRLIEGASWSEANRGTNAIGTAAIERRPTVVLGRAHFARSYHRLACYAAPVLDAHGGLVGVLDATSTVERAVPEIGAAVFGAARVLSELLRLEAYAGVGSSMLRLLSRTLDRCGDPALLIEAPGRVSRMNAAAREQLEGAFAGGDVEALLGIDWATLTGIALDPPPGGRTVKHSLRLHAEPVLDRRGQPIAVLVRLEPPPRVRAPRPAPVDAPSSDDDVFAPIFAEDASLLKAIDWARLVASSELPVMLLAETGSGKELFAQAIHRSSARADGPFVAVNCGAVAPTLLESELFGYAAGAFTGADRRGRPGLFAAASGGTLFLDEVAEMPLAMQAALLRVLESGTYQRVGDPRSERCDVRVICATCRDLDDAVARGAFRQDLYYRLKGASLRLPALRDRSDVVPLARTLLASRAKRAGWRSTPSLTGEAERRIAAHDWPGNVRELISALDVALVTARGAGADEIGASHLPIDVRHTSAREPAGALERAEEDALRRALDAHRGNVSAAARELGVARSTLYRLARRFGLTVRGRGRERR